MNSNLLDVLKACLNSNTVVAAENILKQLSLQPNFTEQLLMLIPKQDSQILIMVLSTLKNYILAKYNAQENPINPSQKSLLRDNVFNLFYQISENQQALNLYKEIIYAIILVDYPWNGIQELISLDLDSKIMASVYFFRQITKKYEWMTGKDREELQYFINNYFGKVQGLVQKILSNYNEATAKLLEQILKTFYSSAHIEIPQYFRNFNNLDKWILYLKTILDAPIQSNTLNQRRIGYIYLKLFAMYCSDQQDDKYCQGWAHSFRQRYAEGLFDQCYRVLTQKNIDEETSSALLNCIQEVVNNPKLRVMLNQSNCDQLIYGYLLGISQSSHESLELFGKNPIEYIRREDDLTCNSIRHASFNLIERIANYCSFGGKSELIKFIEFAASSLDSSATSDSLKEVIIRLLTKLGTIILKNKYLKSQFEALTIRYFIPLLKSTNTLHNALTSQLLSLYLPKVQLSPNIVRDLMSIIYESLIAANSLVLKYNAILAFTALLEHPAALEAAKPHFQSILEIYIKMLDSLDHENLLCCLQSIVKNFSQQIVLFACDLVTHMIKLFYSCYNKDESNEDEEDGNSQATAALSTIRQILHCNLTEDTYFKISQEIVELFRGIMGDFNLYFDQILSLLNVLLHQTKQIAQFQFVYVACRKFYQGDNLILKYANIPNQLADQIAKTQKVDSQYEETLISILKNLIQKMPDNILHKFPLPTNPQLILALIENKRLQNNQLVNLDTREVDEIWAMILQSYSFIVYGVGNVSQPKDLKLVTGVSLYPWLKQKLNGEVLRHIVSRIEDEEDDENDDLLEENTMQLLQKYANEEEDQQDFYASAGINYSHLYESPFDCTKDKEFLILQLKNLNQNAASLLMNSLSPKIRKKIESLFT